MGSGSFRVYEDAGVLGFQVPDIDFYWGGGIISPEFREYVVAHGFSLYEKCIIYDGGARRYEIPDHVEEVKRYWNAVLEASDRTDIMELTYERIGYRAPIEYDEWLKTTHFQKLGDDEYCTAKYNFYNRLLFAQLGEDTAGFFAFLHLL